MLSGNTFKTTSEYERQHAQNPGSAVVCCSRLARDGGFIGMDHQPTPPLPSFVLTVGADHFKGVGLFVLQHAEENRLVKLWDLISKYPLIQLTKDAFSRPLQKNRASLLLNGLT